jgi:hypothetical protein
VQSEDWDHYRKYNEYMVAIEEMLERTDTEWGPWTIVEATDRRWARVKIFQTIIRRLEEALEEHGFELPEDEPVPQPEAEAVDEPAKAMPEEEINSESLETELTTEAEIRAGDE